MLKQSDDFEHVEQAYQNLPPAEKVEIDFLANELLENMKKKRQERGSKTPMQFGPIQARQLIYALRAWLISNPSYKSVVNQ